MIKDDFENFRENEGGTGTGTGTGGGQSVDETLPDRYVGGTDVGGNPAVNLATGRLRYEFEDLSIGRGTFLIGVTHVYNSKQHNNAANAFNCFGSNWKLNLSQFIWKNDASGETYKYSDEKGDVHSFIKFDASADKTRYYDEADANTVLVVQSGARYIEDGAKNKLFFDDQGYLTRSVSRQGIEENYVYRNNKLISVYDTRSAVNGAAANRLELTYDVNGRLYEITAFDGGQKQSSVRCGYKDGNLASVTSAAYNSSSKELASKQIYRFGYENGLLTLIADSQTKDAVSAEYLDGKAVKICGGYICSDSAPTLGSGFSLGQTFCGETFDEFVKRTEQTISYATAKTVVTNEKGVAIAYFYDRNYRITSNFEQTPSRLRTLTRQGAKRTGLFDEDYLCINGNADFPINSSVTLNLPSDFKLTDKAGEKDTDRFEYAFWLKHEIIDASDLTLKFTYELQNGESRQSYTRAVRLNAQAYKAWQRVSVPIRLPRSDGSVLNVGFKSMTFAFYNGSQIASGIVINEIGFSPAPHSEMYLSDGLAVSDIREVYVDGVKQNVYLTEDDVASTCAQMFGSNVTDDVICNGAGKRIAGGGTVKLTDGVSVENILKGGTPYSVKTFMPSGGGFATAAYSYGTNELTVTTTYQTDSASSSTVTVTDYNGNVREEKDEYGVKKVYSYDSFGNLTSVSIKDSDGTEVSRAVYSYDAQGRLTQTGDGITGQSVQYKGDLAQETREQYADANGNYVDTSRRIRNIYGVFKDKTVAVKEYAGEELKGDNRIGYENGRIRTLTDGLVKFGMRYSHKTDETSYTQFVGKTEEVVQTEKVERGSDGSETHTASYYNDGGSTGTSSVATKTDKYGRVTKVTYAQQGCADKTVNYTYGSVRESELTAPLVKKEEAGLTASYSYDDSGNLVAWSEPTNKGTFAVRQLSESSTKYTLGSDDIISVIGYDTKAVANPHVTSVKYYRDNNASYDEPTEMKVFDTVYSYDKAGRISGKEVYNGGKYEYKYLPKDYSTVKRITYKNYGDCPELYDRTICFTKNKTFSGRDAVSVESNVSWVKQINSLQGEEININSRTTYVYDSHHRIAKEIVREYLEDGNYSICTKTYTYFGSRLTSVHTDKKLYDSSSVYVSRLENSTTEYTYTNKGLTKIGDTEYGYDKCGNRISRKRNGNTLTYCYEYGDKLSKVGSGIYYGYNSDGVRSYKNVNGEYSYYCLDGNKIIAEQRGENTIRYFYDIHGVAGFSGSLSGTGRYVLDEEGSVVMILDTNGKNAEAYYVYDTYGNATVYDAWGKVDTDPTSIGNTNPFRWKGFYYDTETGLYYANGSYYDPQTGTYLDAVNMNTIFENAYSSKNLYKDVWCFNSVKSIADFYVNNNS